MVPYFFSNFYAIASRLLFGILLFSALSVLLAGCGQSGPLKLPAPEEDKKEEAAK